VEDAQEFVSCVGLHGFEVCAEVESAGAEDGAGLECGERVAERFVVDVGFDAGELVGFDGALRVGEGGGGAIEVVGFVGDGGGDVDAELVAEVEVEVEGGDEFAVFGFAPPLAWRELFEKALDLLLHAVPAIHCFPPCRIASARASAAMPDKAVAHLAFWQVFLHAFHLRYPFGRRPPWQVGVALVVSGAAYITTGIYLECQPRWVQHFAPHRCFFSTDRTWEFRLIHDARLLSCCEQALECVAELLGIGVVEIRGDERNGEAKEGEEERGVAFASELGDFVFFAWDEAVLLDAVADTAAESTAPDPALFCGAVEVGAQADAIAVQMPFCMGFAIESPSHCSPPIRVCCVWRVNRCWKWGLMNSAMVALFQPRCAR
jgi:hypothetical protein